MSNWIDNGDSYTCPVCGYEVCNPHYYPGSRCPACGFQDPKDAPQCPICSAGHEIIVYAKTNDPKEKGEYRRRTAKCCPECGKELKHHG